MALKRRDMIRSLAAAVTLAPATTHAVAHTGIPHKPTKNTLALCRRGAGELAEAMTDLVGGQWRVSVDKDLEFILISKVV